MKTVHYMLQPFVVLSACRFYIKFFQIFQWRLFCMQVKLVSVLENKKQLIRIRVCGKKTASSQTDGDGKRRTDDYKLVLYADNFDFKALKLPLKIRDIYKIERKKPIDFSVACYGDKKKYPLYVLKKVVKINMLIYSCMSYISSWKETFLSSLFTSL